MPERINTITQIARKLGLILGIFYLIRFICIPLSMTYPGLSVLYALMFVSAPFLYGYLTMIVREKKLNGILSFKEGFLFLFNMIFCGTLIEALTHFIYFRFIDGGMLTRWYITNLNDFENQVGPDAYIEQMKEYVNTLSLLSAIDITMTMFTNGIMWTLIFSVLIAVILRKKENGIMS